MPDLWSFGFNFVRDPDTTNSERHWIYAPIVCSLLLMAGMVAGVVRAFRLTQGRGVPLLPTCHWLTARWATRITAWGALVAGIVGMSYAARRLVMHWSYIDDVPPVLIIFALLTYGLMFLALLLAALGLRWHGKPQAHRAFRQSAKASLLAGLSAGLATEVLTDFCERESQVPESWRRSFAMLGGSCGLLLLGLLAAQADGQAEREGAMGEAEGRNQQAQAASREGEEGVVSGPVLRHDSESLFGGGEPGWSGRPWPWPSTARETDWPSLPEHREDSRSGDLREPLMTAFSPSQWESLPRTRIDSLDARFSSPLFGRLVQVSDWAAGSKATESKATESAATGEGAPVPACATLGSSSIHLSELSGSTQTSSNGTQSLRGSVNAWGEGGNYGLGPQETTFLPSPTLHTVLAA
ncbi:unnamed protein product [Polarella glacialis]|nr:unnamed protein product [Polarella glacialis]